MAAACPFRPRERGGKVRNEQVLRMFLLSALDPVDARVSWSASLDAAPAEPEATAARP
jgi:hypothetical protein